ncbi:ABC transporter ATP-binding protein [Myxococcota bacterium]|nr:ABC transporter ATP-binding protein [Myxococcota bacterium]
MGGTGRAADPTPPATGLAISLRGVRRSFRTAAEGTIEAVAGIDLTATPGDFLALLGPSGCGKTTLLRILAGLDRPDAGEVLLDGAAPDPGPHTARRLPIAYVFQDAHLLPWRDVLGNVALPLELLGHAAGRCRSEALEAVERVGLADAIRRRPAQLSGGMRMRVSLARALVTRPRLLLLDEPFAALDEISRQGLDEQLRSLWIATGMTVIFVTHSIAEATFLAERAIVLSRRPARVVLEHALDLPLRRDAALRADPRFARETGVLQDALRRGAEAGAAEGAR